MTRYRILHRTTYAYAAPASSSRSLAHLRPRETPRQRVVSHALEVDPEPLSLRERLDAFGNTQHAIEVIGAHPTLRVVSRAEVEVDEPPALPSAMSGPWEAAVGQAPPLDDDGLEAAQFALESPHIPLGAAFAAEAAPFFAPGAPILEAALAFNAHLHRTLAYEAGSTDVATPLDEVLRQRRGVCQDFAHLALASLRSLGLPARYVSGYLRTVPVAGGPALVGADASHAWISLRCGSLGWVDLDPTNDCLAGDRHVTVAYGRDFSDVTPIKGVLVGGGRGQEVTVAVEVTPV